MNKRNGYLISKALHTFMWASILSSVAQLLSTLVDAIVVSNLIGPDAISAVNVSVPVLSMVGCFAILPGIGGSIVAAKAMGLRKIAVIASTGKRLKIAQQMGACLFV